MLLSFDYTPKERLKFPLRIRIIGKEHAQEEVTRPHGIGPWQWFFCVKGRGEVTINGIRSIIYPGDCFFIPSHIPHLYHKLDSEWLLDIVGFDGELVPALTAFLKIDQPGIFQMTCREFFPDFVQKLTDLSSSRDSGIKQIFSKACYAFLLDISAFTLRIPGSISLPGSGLVMEIVSYLEAHYQEEISLDCLSASLGKTKEYLCSVFKKGTGHTIIFHLTEMRIARARTLLLSFPDKKVEEIARECGFSNPSYFGARFKAFCKVTPEQYRLQQLRMYQ